MTAPADPAGAEKEIKRVWERFFNPATSVEDKVALVEDGEMNSLMVEAFAKDERSGQIVGRAGTVRFTSPAEAEVTYALFRNSTTVQPFGRGKAVRQDDAWKISFTTMCSLTKYGADVPKAAAC
ncbi:hypothetical protein [Nonomuraea dietziae]